VRRHININLYLKINKDKKTFGEGSEEIHIEAKVDFFIRDGR
jgi:hypothetical protein